MYTLAILVWIGCIYSFVHLILGLKDAKVFRRVNRFFGIGLVIIGIMLVIGITSYIYTGSNNWIMGTYLGLMIIAGLVFFSGAISLILQKSEKKTGENKSIKAYGWLNLAGYVLFFSAPFLYATFKIYLISIAIIYVNLIPIIWLKFYFLRHFMQFSSDENLKLLDIVSQKYQISKREQEVMDLILQGKSNQEIEEMLFISYSTVKNHIYNIYQKLGVKSRGQMIRFVFEASRFEEKPK
jgi:DNA-binding CsgD family transcriptional regulator